MPVITADQAFNEWLARASRETLLCRSRKWGHIWPEPEDLRCDYVLSRRMGITAMVSPCLRGCGLVRTTYLAPAHVLETWGISSASSYDYTKPDYLFKGDPHNKTPGTNIGQEHRDAILEAVAGLVPADRIKEMD